MSPQYIVAIGGSAGALDALKKFFDHTPLNHTSYIILRHLPEGYKSALNFLLHRHSQMEVLEAKEGQQLLVNKIYYAPPHHHLVIRNGNFHLVPRKHIGPNRAINTFLESLSADENKTKAIAVILSGTGKDGVDGTPQ